jgi:hypothetical protein
MVRVASMQMEVEVGSEVRGRAVVVAPEMRMEQAVAQAMPRQHPVRAHT